MKKFFFRFLAVSIIGILVSAYLLFHQIEIRNGYQFEESFCSINQVFDCDSIALSSYSEIFNIPVPSLGLFYYLLFAVFLLIQKKSIVNEKDLKKTAAIVFFYSWLALPSTLFLFSISSLYLKKVCLFCSLLYIVNILLCILSFLNPDRPRGFFKGLIEGLKEFFKFFFSRSTKSSVFILISLISGYLIYITPQKILIPYYFEPRLATMFDPKTFEPFINLWKTAPVEKLKLNLEGEPSKKDFSLGNSQAALTIVEFADYECPFCKIVGKRLKSILEDNPGKYRLIYKNFPLDKSCNRTMNNNKHQFACQAAMMARCAGMQSDQLFWKMNQALIELKDFNATTLDQLPLEIGLNLDSYKKCLEQPEAKDKILEDIEEAINLNIKSTPTLFYNNKRILSKKLYNYLLPGLLKSLYEETQKTNP